MIIPPNSKSVAGYEGYYAVTPDGRVFRVASGCYTYPGRELKKRISNGYNRMCLFRNGIGKDKFVHRIVAEAFIPNPQMLPQINHKNGNRLDNRMENLEWCTSGDNQRHAYRVLGKKKPKLSGTKGRYVYGINIRTGKIIETESIHAAARLVNGDHRHIMSVCKGRQKTAYGYIWKYL